MRPHPDTSLPERALLPLLRWLFDLLLPRHCAGCRLPDATWCADCARTLRTPFAVVREATAQGPPAYALGRYLGPARRAVLALKERGRRDLRAPLGQALAEALLKAAPPTPPAVPPPPNPHPVLPAPPQLSNRHPAPPAAPQLPNPHPAPATLQATHVGLAPAAALPGVGLAPAATELPNRHPASPTPPAAPQLLPGVRPAPDGTWYLVPAPSRPSAVRRRGGSHLLALARQCAAALAAAGHPAAVAPVLRLDRRARDSVGLSAAARSANLRGRLHLVPTAAPPPGQPVILLDDVLTTGTTAAACTTTLAAAGIPVTAIVTLTATV